MKIREMDRISAMYGFLYTSLFSTGYFAASSTEDALMQDVLSDSSFLCIILALSCAYFMALSRLISKEKRHLKSKFQGIVDSVTKLNQQIKVLENMILVMKDTSKRESLYLRPGTRPKTAHPSRKREDGPTIRVMRENCHSPIIPYRDRHIQ